MLEAEQAATDKQFLGLGLSHLCHCSMTQSPYHLAEGIITALSCAGTFIFLLVFFLLLFLKYLFVDLLAFSQVWLSW